MKAGNIIEEINCVMADYHMRTGGPACSIYLGRFQMGRLMKWTKDDNRFIDKTEKEMRHGKSRLEVMGIPVYEVNDEDHCAVA